VQHRRSLSISLLISALAVTGAPAGASAAGIAHKVPPGAGVVVSFDLRGSGGDRAALVRFPRNRAALVRVAHRRLALRVGRQRALLRLRPRRRVRVHVRFDLDAARISARATARRVAIRRRLQPEARVVVARALRRVVVKRLLRRRPPDQIAPAAPTPAGARLQLFAPTSVWNQPLAADAPVDPASATLVQTLRNTVAQTDAWVQWQGTSPLYVVPAGQPTARVQLDTGSWGATLRKALKAVPIPANAVPAEGSDAHMTIYQPSTDRLWELFQARKLADGWHASWGGAMSKASLSPGFYNADSWPGMSNTSWGATASSLPVIAGTMLARELRAGVIAHAIAISIPWAKPNVYAWPAQRTDGKSTDPNAIPEGARFRLDPTLNVDALNLSPAVRAIAIAAQRYGMIVRDQTGQAVGLFAENTAQFGTNPYDGTTGIYGGIPNNLLMRAFPWDKLQVVKMDLRSMK
jgi:hypothetical protein